MQILGIRTSSKCIRYAVVNWDGQNATLVNADNESKLNFPAGIEEIADKLVWLHAELERIFRKYPDLSRVAVKMNQFVPEKMANRYSTNLDGVVMLAAKQNGKSASTVLYANIEKGMSSAKIKSFAEGNVGCSSKYWDAQMADAVAAAWTRRDG